MADEPSVIKTETFAEKYNISRRLMGAGYVLFYPVVKALKSLYNIATGYKVPRSLFRLSLMFLASAAVIALTSGFVIPGLTDWLVPKDMEQSTGLGSFGMTYMAMYVTSLVAKYMSQLFSFTWNTFWSENEPVENADNQVKSKPKQTKIETINLKEPINYTNPSKYSWSYLQNYKLEKNCPKDHIVNREELYKEMQKLKGAKDGLYYKESQRSSYTTYFGFYFDPLDAEKQKDLNDEIEKLRNIGSGANENTVINPDAKSDEQIKLYKRNVISV